MPAEERSPGSRSGQEGIKAMITDESLTGSNKVQKFQKVLYVKAKAEPEFQFYALSDKMWRDDFLQEAYRMVRRNGGIAGVDGESFADIEVQGVEDWLGELSPIFEADLQDEQYAYRARRSVNDAVKRAHSLLNRGFNEVMDCDLSNYFGEIPHAQLMKSVARRVSDGRMLGLINAWLEMPVVAKDSSGEASCRARKERKGTPQGAPISPLLREHSHNLY